MAQVVLPGDELQLQKTDDSSVVKLGPGLLPARSESAPAVIASRRGIIGHHKTKLKGEKIERYWVEGSSRRYVPATGESVVGIIIAKHADGYRVDIASAQMATLDALAFEGATKRSKPNLKVGAIVYARISLCFPFTEPELECFDSSTQKSEGFGELIGGMLVRSIELERCRALLSKSHPLLPSLGRRIPFEVAIGMNGRALIKSADPASTIELMQQIAGTA